MRVLLCYLIFAIYIPVHLYGLLNVFFSKLSNEQTQASLNNITIRKIKSISNVYRKTWQMRVYEWISDEFDSQREQFWTIWFYLLKTLWDNIWPSIEVAAISVTKKNVGSATAKRR